MLKGWYGDLQKYTILQTPNLREMNAEESKIYSHRLEHRIFAARPASECRPAQGRSDRELFRGRRSLAAPPCG